MKRQIIEIDENRCNGCGNCITGCHEGALQLIDGKARLISDLFCDGLGACIGTCPVDAIKIIEREAEPYSEAKVMEQMASKGSNTIKAHLEHLFEHGEMEYFKQGVEYIMKNDLKINFNPSDIANKNAAHGGFHGGCPSANVKEIKRGDTPKTGFVPSQLANWPIQLSLINPEAPYLENADLLISADCAPFSYGSFHDKFIKNKIVIMFCPKLDTDKITGYIDKLAHIFKNKKINSVSVVRMEVPCCGGTVHIVQEAIKKANVLIPIKEYTVSIEGELI